MDHILIDIVMERLPFEFPAPLETFVRGVEHHLAPAVVYNNLKIGNLALNFLG